MTDGGGMPEGIYDLASNDPAGELYDSSGLQPSDRAQIDQIMNAMARLREAEEALAESSSRHMKLGRTDMRALHFLIVCEHRGEPATPSELAAHLGVSTAATTKLLDRLVAGGHVRRSPHPFDRRALTVHVSPATRSSAMATVGRQHARRLIPAARLTAEERDVVIRFLMETAQQLWPSVEE